MPKLTIQNVDDIKSSTSNPRLIHFTTRQWEKAIKGIPVEDYDPVRHGKLSGLAGYQNPDEVIIYPHCEPGKDEVCMMSQKFAGGALSFECKCRPKRGGGGTVQLPQCRTVIQNGRIQCTGQCSGRCAMVLITIVIGTRRFFTLVCRCVA